MNRRPLASYAKVQKWVGNLIRNRSFQLGRERVRGLRYLDLGCGRNAHKALVNMDYLWHPEVDLCWDIRDRLPFADARFDGIFSEHCFEHFSLPVGVRLLQECRRVLSPGGTLRIVVPDAETYLRTYCRKLDGDESARFPYQDLESFDGSFSPILSVNRVFYQDREALSGHCFMFDFHVLDLLLRKCGFDRVCRVAFGKGRDPVLLVDSPARALESLYVEASVPE